MANVKKGNLTPSPQWAKHLRDWKRFFWKGERQAEKTDLKDRIAEEATGKELVRKPEPKIIDTTPTAWNQHD